MPTLPISFFIAVGLAVILLRLVRSDDQRFGLFAKVTLAGFVLQSILFGLNWGYGLTEVVPLQGAMATLIPPLTWITLHELISRENRQLTSYILCGHGIIAIMVLMSRPFGFFWIDYLVIGIFMFYGIVLLNRAFREQMEWLDRVPFQRLVTTNTAFVAVGVALILSAVIDLAVSYDLSRAGGEHAADIVGVANLALLIVLSVSVIMVGQGRPTPDTDTYRPDAKPSRPVSTIQPTIAELRQLHSDILTQLDDMIVKKRIYRDPNLSLDRLARKTLIPSRQISSAINSMRSMNVPQYVNTFRVIEACERLKNTDAAITEIIFDVGFQTKSNFNREFLRVVGLTPSEWRNHATDQDDDPSKWNFLRRFFGEFPVPSGVINLAESRLEHTENP